MTLTAITKQGRLINPSVLIANGHAEAIVLVGVKNAEAAGVFCPHCLKRTGVYHPVKFRNAQVRAKHFYHPANLESAAECSTHSSESEKHLAAKVAINDWIAQSNPDEQDLDCHWMISDGAANRKPDVWVRRGALVEAHEIQISPISADDLRQRTLDLKHHGATSVHWYLYGGVFCPTNRQTLRSLGAKVFHLWFENGDAAFPKWKLDTGEGLNAIPRGASASDNCATRPKASARPEQPSARTINVITHKRKPGWEGVIYDWPWNLPDMLDVQWVKVPSDSRIPITPARYPLRDLLLDNSDIQPREAQNV